MIEESHVVDLIPAYALDCLDEMEMNAVTTHLAGCANCRQELLTYQRLADLLPLALVQSAPPPSVKLKLMENVTQSLAPASTGKRPAWMQRLVASVQQHTPAWGLASLAVVILLAFSNLYLWQHINRLNQSELPVYALVNTAFAPDAAGTIVVSRDGQHGALVVDRLAPLDPNQQYQLWLIKGSQHTDGGVFSTDKSGYAVLYVDSPEPLASYDGFGITIEPAGGNPSPSGVKVLEGQL